MKKYQSETTQGAAICVSWDSPHAARPADSILNSSYSATVWSRSFRQCLDLVRKICYCLDPVAESVAVSSLLTFCYLWLLLCCGDYYAVAYLQIAIKKLLLFQTMLRFRHFSRRQRFMDNFLIREYWTKKTLNLFYHYALTILRSSQTWRKLKVENSLSRSFSATCSSLTH